MPCYQVRTMSVEFKAGNAGLLEAAVKGLGLTLWVSQDGRLGMVSNRYGTKLAELNLAAGQATICDGMQPRLNELKRAYAVEAVKAKCRQFRWTPQFDSTGLAGKMIKTSF